MSDTLHEAEEKFQYNLEKHLIRYENDPEYRDWWDKLPARIVVIPTVIS